MLTMAGDVTRRYDTARYRDRIDSPETLADACRLCGTPLPDPAARCPACGMHPARTLSRSTKWRIAAGLAALYAFVAVVLILTR
jgi:hypothetical protein